MLRPAQSIYLVTDVLNIFSEISSRMQRELSDEISTLISSKYLSIKQQNLTPAKSVT